MAFSHQLSPFPKERKHAGQPNLRHNLTILKDSNVEDNYARLVNSNRFQQ